MLGRFLKTKNEDRKVEYISVVELNEYISQLIISDHTKDGTDYEPSSLQSLIASFERNLKKKSYSAKGLENSTVFSFQGRFTKLISSMTERQQN